MRRVVITLMLALILILTLGTSVALAKGPPESIIIVPSAGIHRIIFDGDDGISRPDINVLTPKGRIVPPDIAY